MYTSERITDSSYPDLQYLYRLCFGIKTGVKELNRKYDTSMFGLKNMGVMARDDKNEVAAYYGVFPIILEYEKAEYLVAQSGDTMTSPYHQKKGLFTRLAKECYEMAEKAGVHFVFGFPNENSFHGFRKNLEWIFTGTMQKFTIKVNTLPLCELTASYRIFEPAYQKFVATSLNHLRMDPEKSDLSPFGFSNVKGQILKDIRFFRYKLSNKGNYLINTNGFTMLIRVETHLIIGAVGKFKKADTKNFISVIKKLAFKLGCRKINVSVSINHWLYEFLKTEIQPVDSLPVGFYHPGTRFNPEEIQFSGGDYDTF